MSPSRVSDWFNTSEVYVTSSVEFDFGSVIHGYGVRPVSFNYKYGSNLLSVVYYVAVPV